MTELDSAEARAITMLERYDDDVRRQLESLGSTMLPDLDDAAALLRSALATSRAVHVGFLGESQVGKSSLINAVVGQPALPSGGVGPLTAQATRLRHAPTASLKVRYHDRKRLNYFRFAFSQYLVARGELSVDPETDDEGQLDDPTAASWVSGATAETEDGRPARSETSEYLLKQAGLMLGTKGLPASLLHDGIRGMLGLPPLGDARSLEPHLPRIEEIRALLGSTAAVDEAGLGAAGFAASLAENAAGWRSPLVAHLDLALSVDLLTKVELVDLPGVGVVGDPAGRVAEEFVRDDAAALVIVARNNGLTHEVVSLLERTGVITRLLFGGDATKQNPIHVIFAITRLDDVAEERWKDERQRAKQQGTVPPTRDAVYTRLSAEMTSMAKEQVRNALASSSAFHDLSPELRSRREAVVRELCDRLDVVCVSAKDYLNLQSDDEEERNLAFVRDAATTNIPLFRDCLTQLAARAAAARGERIRGALDSFRRLLALHLEALASATGNGTTSQSDADRFRDALNELVPPFRNRAMAQRREVASYLNDTIPPKLEGIAHDAAATTRRRLTRLRNDAAKLNWSSLNAALVRNGTWSRQNIDFPAKLTSSFVETIAGSWEPTILDEVRRVVRQLVKDHTDLVEEFLGKASELSGGDELLLQIRAQQRVLTAQGRSAVGWTSEQLNELSEEVRKKLGTVVGKPIERACIGAVQAGGNRGAGAKDRIIAAFEAGGTNAIERAEEQCGELLLDQFRKLRQSLGRLLRENEDPISLCYEAVVQEGAERAARAGEHERERRRTLIAALRASFAIDDTVPMSLPATLGKSSATSSAIAPMTAPLRPAGTAIFGEAGGHS